MGARHKARGEEPLDIFVCVVTDATRSLRQGLQYIRTSCVDMTSFCVQIIKGLTNDTSYWIQSTYKKILRISSLSTPLSLSLEREIHAVMFMLLVTMVL